MRRGLFFGIVVIIALGLIGGGAWYLRAEGKSKTVFRMAAIKRGDIRATIGATGTVEPEEVVDIGAQVAGQIVSFGKDDGGVPIDYSSAVEAGTVLAKIDDSLYVAQEEQANASLEQAKANQARADADLLQKQATLDQARRDWERAQKLGPSEALAPTQYDAYKASYEIAKANVTVDEAAIAQAKAAVTQAQAVLDFAKRNLAYCTITSPVKGVIIDRRVNIGQTVVASLSAPSLFLLAKDLNRMEVWAAVNEADIGNIYEGQPVTFTVDAFPNEVFHGEVSTVRLNATITQNVVTYTVEVAFDNSSGKMGRLRLWAAANDGNDAASRPAARLRQDNGRLLPYLTANLNFETARRRGVLTVPNAALRWTPQLEQVAPEFRDEAARSLRLHGEARSRPAASRPSSESATSGAARQAAPPAALAPAAEGRRGTLWVIVGNGLLRPIDVRAGITDGINTEVQGAELQEGMEVVTGEQQQQAGGKGTVNPFTPQMPRRSQPSGPGAGGGGESR
jgi:HlyD family secretion protein